MAFEQAAYDRARQHADRARADALDKPEREQRGDQWRERATEAAERASPASITGLRPKRSASGPTARGGGREAGEKDRDRRRGLALVRAEFGLNERQARQRHVDRERRQHGHRGEKGEKARP